ncbi:MAG: hypothetical protein WC301_01120 [Candidatus Omnitrophota bacterium]|jgi:uncharacterized membrane protein
MRNDKAFKSFVFLSGSGCMLPFLMIFNLFFGWIFLRPAHWLIVESILVLFFVVNGLIMTRRVISAPGEEDDVIDVEAKVVDEKRKIGSS